MDNLLGNWTENEEKLKAQIYIPIRGRDFVEMFAITDRMNEALTEATVKAYELAFY